MRQLWLLAAIGALSLCAAGCGGSGGDDAQADANSSAAAAKQDGGSPSVVGETDGAGRKVESDGRTPKRVVEILMGAMLAHDQDTLDSMVTKKARDAGTLKAEARKDIKFRVGDVEMLSDDNAHVASAWYMSAQDGTEDPVMTLWMLRREPEGFRVYGSVMVVPELSKYDGGKVVFDFEDAEQVAATENRVYALLEQESGGAAEASVAEKSSEPTSTQPQ